MRCSKPHTAFKEKILVTDRNYKIKDKNKNTQSQSQTQPWKFTG